METVERKIKKESSNLQQSLVQKDAEISSLKTTIDKLKFDNQVLASKVTEIKQLEFQRDELVKASSDHEEVK